MGDEPRPGRDAVAGHGLQHAVGEHVLRQLQEAKQRQRRLLRRLQDLHVAGRERRSHLPDRHHQRVVPRADAGDDPDRLPPHHRRVALDVLACALALEVASRAGEEAKVVGRERHLLPRERDRLADVPRLDLRELLGVVGDHVGELQQQFGRSPGVASSQLGQRLLRALDSCIDLVGGHVRDAGDRLAGRRIHHFERRIGCCCHRWPPSSLIIRYAGSRSRG